MAQPGVYTLLWRLKRLCQKTRRGPLRRLYVFLYEVGQFASGSWISWESRFDGMPCLPHGMRGIFVSRAARIGRNCVILPDVTIGSNALPDSRNVGSPIVGDNCYIGSGARIIGRVTVGNNVRVGANCVVYESVPDNSVVVSGAMKVKEKERVDNRYYAYRGKWVYFDDGRWIEEKDPGVLETLSRHLGGERPAS